MSSVGESGESPPDATRSPVNSASIPANREAREQGFEIHLTPQMLLRGFAAAVVILVICQFVVQTLRFSVDLGGSLGGLVALFSLGSDRNIPTAYSGFALLFSAILLAARGSVARAQADRDWLHWYSLAVVFAFLTVDETMEIHERLNGPVQELLGTGGILFYAWVVPYGTGTLLLLILFWRFLSRLPRSTAYLMALSGVIFIAGAIGMELLGGLHFERYGSQNPGYVVLQSVEEILEMSGIVLFIYTLAVHLERDCGPLTLRLGGASARSRAG